MGVLVIELNRDEAGDGDEQRRDHQNESRDASAVTRAGHGSVQQTRDVGSDQIRSFTPAAIAGVCVTEGPSSGRIVSDWCGRATL